MAVYHEEYAVSSFLRQNQTSEASGTFAKKIVLLSFELVGFDAFGYNFTKITCQRNRSTQLL